MYHSMICTSFVKPLALQTHCHILRALHLSDASVKLIIWFRVSSSEVSLNVLSQNDSLNINKTRLTDFFFIHMKNGHFCVSGTLRPWNWWKHFLGWLSTYKELSAYLGSAKLEKKRRICNIFVVSLNVNYEKLLQFSICT